MRKDSSLFFCAVELFRELLEMMLKKIFDIFERNDIRSIIKVHMVCVGKQQQLLILGIGILVDHCCVGILAEILQ